MFLQTWRWRMWAQSSPRLAFVLFLLYSYSSKWPRHESLTKIKILMKMLIYLKNHFKKIGSFRKSKGWITDIVPVSAEGNKTSKIFTFQSYLLKALSYTSITQTSRNLSLDFSKILYCSAYGPINELIF